jgi:hypothetical protein
MAAHRSANATVPAHGAKVITPSDATILEITRGLYIGSTGDVIVTMADGDEVTFSAVPTGVVLPIQVLKVKAATTASLILALY